MPVKLTGAQRDALSVLADAHPKKVEGHKRSSQAKPVARINYLAAGSLCRVGLAERHFKLTNWSPYRHDETYTITEAGIEIVAAWDSRGSM